MKGIEEHLTVAGDEMSRQIDPIDFHSRATGNHPVKNRQGNGNAHARLNDVRKERIAFTIIIVGVSPKAQFIGHEIGESLRALTIADSPRDPDKELSAP